MTKKTKNEIESETKHHEILFAKWKSLAQCAKTRKKRKEALHKAHKHKHALKLIKMGS